MAIETVTLMVGTSWTLLSAAAAGPFEAQVRGPVTEVAFYFGSNAPAADYEYGLTRASVSYAALGAKVWARARAAVAVTCTRTVDPGNTAETILPALTLSASSFAATVAAGAEIATIVGRIAGDAIDGLLPGDGRLVLSSDKTKILRGLSPVAVGLLDIELVASHPASPNSPRRTKLALTVTNGAGVLGPTTAAFVAGAASGTPIASITGLGVDETVASVSPNDGRLALDTSRRSLLVGLSASSAGTIAATLTTNAGRTLAMTLTVSPASGARPVPAMSGLRVPDRLETQSSGNFLSLQVLPGVSPNRRLKNPRALLPGYYCNNGGASPTERQCPNTFKVRFALGAGAGAANKRRAATIAGTATTTRGGAGSLYGYSTSHDWGAWTDPIKEADGSDFIIEPNTPLLAVSQVLTAASTDKFPGQIPSSASAIGNVSRSNAATDFGVYDSYMTGTGTITQVSNGPATYGPTMIVGEDMETGELVSILLTGDSRFWGNNDFGSGMPSAQAHSARQAGARAMVALGLPYANVSMSGSTPYADTSHRYAGIAAVMALYGGQSPFTHTLSNHGNNGSLSSNIAGCVAEREGLRTLLGAGVKHVKATLPPRVGNSASSDYRTVMGQLPDAADSYPNGARAALNNSFLANAPDANGNKWDAVIDMGLYGSAAKGMAKTDPNWDAYRSRFPVGPSTTLAKNWTVSTSIYMTDQTLKIGDHVSIGSTFVRGNIAGPIYAGPIDNGDGTWRYALENGGYPQSTTYNAGDAVTRVATGDGTHEVTWVSEIEALAIIEWFNNGRPAQWPAAA